MLFSSASYSFVQFFLKHASLQLIHINRGDMNRLTAPQAQFLFHILHKLIRQSAIQKLKHTTQQKDNLLLSIFLLQNNN